jgi:hypothetical protein
VVGAVRVLVTEDDEGLGAVLGLAIGDSTVRSTGGKWQAGDSPLGGALMSVSWRHAQPHRSGPGSDRVDVAFTRL